MIRFNTLLPEEAVEPAHVKLVRHQDTRYSARRTPYQLWAAMISVVWFGPPSEVNFGPLESRWVGFVDGATQA
jgi:hypothetical protein